MEETQSSNRARFLEFLRLKVAFSPFIRSKNLVPGSLVFYPLRVVAQYMPTAGLQRQPTVGTAGMAHADCHEAEVQFGDMYLSVWRLFGVQRTLEVRDITCAS